MILWALAACLDGGSADRPPAPAPPPPAAPARAPAEPPEAGVVRWATVEGADRCPKAPPPRDLDASRPLVVHWSPAADARLAARELDGLVAFWEGEGLDLAPTDGAPVDRDPLFGDVTTVPVDDPATARATLLGPLGTLVRAVASPPEGALHVVLLDRIAPPGSARQLGFARLSGLTVRADRAAAGTEADPFQGADLPADFDPVVLLSTADLALRRPSALPLTGAHEVGHALGWDHDPAPGQLMKVGAFTCLPGLPTSSTR